MTTKQFKYPPVFQFVRVQIKVMMVLILVLLIALLQSEYQLPQEGYRIALLTIILAPLLCLYIIGSLCEIRTDTDGVYVEFFWKYLFVPWEKVNGIKYVGFRPVGYWIILTDNSLTIFHRLYAVGTLPLLPSFHIHEKIESRDMLLSMIRSKISQNRNHKKQ
jgi:hypothetical protein